MSVATVLVVDDEPEIRNVLQEILEDEHYRVVTAESAASARASFASDRPDLVLLDIWMPDLDGISLLKEWMQDDQTKVPVIMMSGHGTVETAVEAVRLGAQDFIEKPLSTGKLLVTIDRVLQSERLRQENRRLRSRMDASATLVGRSASMQQLRELIERVAAHDTWVLIAGEPGSGKANAARYLHAKSARRDRPLFEVSLPALATENLAVHLFGRQNGEESQAGSFEQARGATLLLEEVADLDLPTQARLFNALEEKRFYRVGGKQPIELDVRVIATTNQDLSRAVLRGTFREDLFYRLNVVPLHVPALHEHRDDVPELVQFFLDWMVENDGLPYRKFSVGALNALRNHNWPGNVRELKNLIQRMLILQREGEVTVAEVEQALEARPVPTRADMDAIPVALFDEPLRAARDRFEKAYLEHHLKRTGGNVSEVAAFAEMERTHLYRKLKGLGIDPKLSKEE